MSELIVIICTVPEEATAENLGRGLVEARLAGCVNAIPGAKSFYRWKGKIESDSAVQLLIKTQPDRFDEIVRWLEEHHPYEVPELVALPADKVSDAYLQWAIAQLE